MGTGSDGADQRVSQAAAADAGATGEVEPAGHFRIYMGAAPGVGKTYAMLSEGHRRQGRGADVVAGFVESYGRLLTEALISGLEVLPRKTVDYRGTRLEEMDLDAVLRRRPEVALIDGPRELAADLGARWYEIEDDDPARALVNFAREHQVTQIVIGSVQHSWWHITDGGSIVRQVIHEAGAFGIDVHLIARHELPPAGALAPRVATDS